MRMSKTQGLEGDFGSIARRRVIPAAALAVGVWCSGANFAAASDISWVGAAGTPLNFGTGGNWAGGAVPGPADNAIINNAGIATVAADFTLTGLGLGTVSGAAGTVQQTGGTMVTTAASYVGGASTSGGGAGTYNISGGTLNVGTGGGDLFVGGGAGGSLSAGNGTLVLSGTGHVTARVLHLGTAGTGVGTLNVSGGSLVVGNATSGTIYIGDNSNGFANFSGGLVQTRDMIVGRIPGGGGTVTQSGGTVTVLRNLVMFERAPDFVINPAPPNMWTMTAGHLSVGNEMYIGAHGTTTFNLSGTGSVSVANALHIAASAAIADPPEGNGVLNMSGGTFAVTGVNSYFVVGDGGPGTFNFSGGAVSTNFYNIGQNFGAVGVVNHTAGAATANFAWVVGEESRGANVYDLSGGTVTVVGDGGGGFFPGDTNLGSGAGGRGTLKVRGTGVAVISGNLRAGGANSFSAGTLEVSGGTVLVGANGSGTGKILMGDNGNGALIISGGFVSTDTVTLGQNAGAVGTGTQTGGTFVVRSDFAVGEASNGLNNFDISGGSLSIGGGSLGGSLFVGSNGTGAFRVSGAGNVSVAGPITNALTGVGSVTVAGGSLTSGGLNNTGVYTQTGGVASLNVAQGPGQMTVSGGTANLTSVAQGTLAVSGTGRVNVAANRGTVNTLTSFSASGTGALNLNDGNLIIDYTSPTPSPLPSITAAITSGYAGGAWIGPGINSAAAAATAGTALGYAEAATLGITDVGGTPVDATAVVVRYTLQGDANLDRSVNIGDFSLLASNFNQAGGWSKGDSNYDGLVNIGDFSLLASQFNQTLTSSVPRAAAVPEPGIASVAALVLLRRRRRD